jgi:hypothetical protein
LSCQLSSKLRKKWNIKIWKTSALAILFNTLNDEVKDHFGSKCTLEEMERMAKDIKVKFD